MAGGVLNLACLLRRRGGAHEAEAARLGRQALALLEAALGKDHAQTQLVRRDWG